MVKYFVSQRQANPIERMSESSEVSCVVPPVWRTFISSTTKLKGLCAMLKKIVSLALVASTFFALQALALTPEQLEAVNLYKSGRYDLAAQKFTIPL